VDTGQMGPSRFKYERARLLNDSGSNRTIVTYVFLLWAGINRDFMQAINEETVEGIFPGVVLQPKHQIELKWYMERGTTLHQATFCVINEPEGEGNVVPESDFEIIICLTDIARHARRGFQTYTVASRRQPEGM
jgi:hypothetical protein